MRKVVYISGIVLFIILFSVTGFSKEESSLAEIWLAGEYKGEEVAIKKNLGEMGIPRVRIQFFTLGIPKGTIAIGAQLSAKKARTAIELARKYNRKKVEFLVPDTLVPDNYLAVGTSAFDERSQIKVNSEQVDQLSNPSLSDEEFHSLYRQFTGEYEGIHKSYY
jgi:hypothetical protein